MPELSRFKGIIIRMYYDDVSQHYKPHVHVFYGGEEAVVALDGRSARGAPSFQPIPHAQWMARASRGRGLPGLEPRCRHEAFREDRTARLGFGECHVCFQRLRLRQSAHSPFGR